MHPTREHQTHQGRHRPVLRLLEPALAEVRPGDGLPRVLDCGGGSGAVAVPLARSAQVTVVDISSDALATLARRAAEAGVGERVTAIQADVEDLRNTVPQGSFDLVLGHGILCETPLWPDVLAQLSAAARPGGLVSLLLTNPVAGVLARALVGDIAGAIGELREPSSVSPAEVVAACPAAGLSVGQIRGVAVFADLVPGSALDAHPGARDLLAQLEQETAGVSPFRDIAPRVHVLARRV